MKTVVKDLGAVGLVTDVDPSELPLNAWSSLSNVRCRRDRIEPMDGYSDMTSLTNANSKDVYAYQLVELALPSAHYWVFPYDLDGDGDAEKIYYYEGSTAAGVNITRQISAADVSYTGGSTDLWQVCNFNGVVILTNGVDAPQYWAGTGKCSFIPYDGSTTWNACDVSETEFDTDGAGGVNDYKAKVIRPFKNFLFALNITEDITQYPQMVHWSNPADPGSVPDSWDYTDATNDAGRTVLSETDGYVLDAVPLGDSLILYKEDAVYRCNYVGGQFVFQFNLITTEKGLYCTNAVVDIGGMHVCVGDGVVYTHQGSEFKNILEGRAADSLFDSIDQTNYKKLFLTHNRPENEVWICYPESGYSWANKALIWNYQYNTWYSRDIPQSSTIKVGIGDGAASTLWSDYTTEIWSDDEGTWVERDYSAIGDTLIAATNQLTNFGSGITSDTVYATRTDILPGEIDQWMMMREIIPHSAGAAFSVSVGKQDVFGDTVTWNTPQTFTPGTTRKLDVRVTSPIFALKFTMTGDTRIYNYTVDMVTAGNR